MVSGDFVVMVSSGLEFMAGCLAHEDPPPGRTAIRVMSAKSTACFGNFPQELLVEDPEILTDSSVPEESPAVCRALEGPCCCCGVVGKAGA